MQSGNTPSSFDELLASLKVSALKAATNVFEDLVIDNLTENEDAVNNDGYSTLTQDDPFSTDKVTIVVDTGDDNDANANNALEAVPGSEFEWLTLSVGEDGKINTQTTMLDSGLLNIIEFNEEGTAAETSTFYDLDDTQEWSVLTVNSDGTTTEIPDFEFPFFEAFDFFA